MYARIKDNRAIEIIDFDPKGKFHESLKWQEVPDNVEQGWTTDGQNWFPPEISTPVETLDKVEAAKIIKKAEISKIAKDKRSAGTTFNDVFLDTDPDTRAALLSAYIQIQRDPAKTYDWKKSDGEWITIDKDNVETIMDAVDAHIQPIFTAEKSAHEDIDKKIKVSTVEEYEISI